MSSFIRHAGSFRSMIGANVRVGGGWRPVQKIWLNVAGVWKPVYVKITLTARNIQSEDEESAGVATATSTVRFLSTGVLRTERLGNMNPGGASNVIVDSADEWIPGGGPGGNFDVMFAPSVGTMSSSSGPDFSWLNASAGLFWTVTVSRGTAGFTEKSCTGTFTIRPAGGGPDLASAVMTLHAMATR